MYKIIIILLLFSSSTNAQFRVTGKKIYSALPKPLDTARIIIITGQSNANSHGQNLDGQFTASTLKTLHWDTTAKTFTPYSSVGLATTGFNTQTAALQSVSKNDSIFCIKIVQGSLAITNWSDSNGALKLALDSALVQSIRVLRNNGKYVKILSTIWLQGEQDCTIGTSVSVYQTRLDTVISQYRNLDVSMNNSQFVIVKLVEGSGGGTYITPALTLDAAYTNLSTSRTKVSLIRPEDIGATLSDTVHYTTGSYILIANAWSALIQ